MNKKTIGWGILILAIFFLNPLPDPTDAFTIQLYSAYSGVDVGLNNLSEVYFDYFIWSSIIGLILLSLALYFLGWNWKKLLKKLDLGKYNLMVGLSIAVVALVAYFDIQGMIYWGSFSTTTAYTLGQQGIFFWNFFKSIVISVFLILPVTYYLVVKRDISESFSLFFTSYTAWMFGFSDILYFIFQRTKIPEFLPWLNNHPVIGGISNLLGFDGVTNISLIISVGIGFLVIFLGNKILKERF